jgi:D-aspartate ligase
MTSLMAKPHATKQLALDATVPVLVLKIGKYVIHHGALGIIRSLGQMGVPVYAVVEDRFTPAAMSRYLTDAFVWGTHGLGDKSVLSGLAEIGQRLGRPAILVPTDDLAAVFIAEHAEALEKWFLFPSLPKELPRRLSNKRHLYFLCKTIGVPCPDAVFPCSVDDVYDFAERTTFPVVVKAAEAHRLPRGARSTSIAKSRKELVEVYRQAESQDFPNLVFQEYIPESCAEDWIVHGYCNPRTGFFVAFTGRKLRSFPAFAGLTTLGESVTNEPLIQQTKAMLKAIGYAGIIDIDCRFDRRDGRYKLLDFNPRIGSNFRMFQDCAGIDVVRWLHLDLTGRRVHPLPAVEGRTLVVEPYDFIASLDYMRHGGLTVRNWWKSLQGKREIAWFTWEDPVPFLAMCVRLLLFAIARAVRSGPKR